MNEVEIYIYRTRYPTTETKIDEPGVIVVDCNCEPQVYIHNIHREINSLALNPEARAMIFVHNSDLLQHTLDLGFVTFALNQDLSVHVIDTGTFYSRALDLDLIRSWLTSVESTSILTPPNFEITPALIAACFIYRYASFSNDFVITEYGDDYVHIPHNYNVNYYYGCVIRVMSKELKLAVKFGQAKITCDDTNFENSIKNIISRIVSRSGYTVTYVGDKKPLAMFLISSYRQNKPLDIPRIVELVAMGFTRHYVVSYVATLKLIGEDVEAESGEVIKAKYKQFIQECEASTFETYRTYTDQIREAIAPV